MGFVVCAINLNLVMESVTRKGREVRLEPSQFHGLFLFMEARRYENLLPEWRKSLYLPAEMV